MSKLPFKHMKSAQTKSNFRRILVAYQRYDAASQIAILIGVTRKNRRRNICAAYVIGVPEFTTNRRRRTVLLYQCL